MRCNQRGVQWPLFVCVLMCILPLVLHTIVHLSYTECLPECVTSHGSIFSRGELCYSVFLCWGGAMVKGYREIWYLVMEWTERKNCKWTNRGLLLIMATVHNAWPLSAFYGEWERDSICMQSGEQNCIHREEFTNMWLNCEVKVCLVFIVRVSLYSCIFSAHSTFILTMAEKCQGTSH